MKKQTYEAGFKKPGPGKILWVEGEFNSSADAATGLKDFFFGRNPNKGYNLYAGPILKKKPA